MTSAAQLKMLQFPERFFAAVAFAAKCASAAAAAAPLLAACSPVCPRGSRRSRK